MIELQGSLAHLYNAMYVLRKAIPVLLVALLAGQCMSPQPTRYENTTEKIDLPRAPVGTEKIKVALLPFRDLTGKAFLVEPATAQLTTMLLQTGYFEVIEPGFIENTIGTQKDLSPEKLQLIKEKFGAQILITGTLTNFEVRKNRSGFCLLFGLLGSYNKEEYIVETGIDYRILGVPDANIRDAGAIENQRTDTSQAAGVLFSYSGASTDILKSSGGKLLRYAMADLVLRIIQNGKYRP
ncbi:MAG: hypothetical protein KDK37_12100 [Leptospiraceae bacterium]|nr:hypothetical protein [Leptospiraceae bacterium]MCB1305018.1 hypothetical protein [Leptospiraceae bacterium]